MQFVVQPPEEGQPDSVGSEEKEERSDLDDSDEAPLSKLMHSSKSSSASLLEEKSPVRSPPKVYRVNSEEPVGDPESDATAEKHIVVKLKKYSVDTPAAVSEKEGMESNEPEDEEEEDSSEDNEFEVEAVEVVDRGSPPKSRSPSPPEIAERRIQEEGVSEDGRRKEVDREIPPKGRSPSPSPPEIVDRRIEGTNRDLRRKDLDRGSPPKSRSPSPPVTAEGRPEVVGRDNRRRKVLDRESSPKSRSPSPSEAVERRIPEGVSRSKRLSITPAICKPEWLETWGEWLRFENGELFCEPCRKNFPDSEWGMVVGIRSGIQKQRVVHHAKASQHLKALEGTAVNISIFPTV